MYPSGHVYSPVLSTRTRPMVSMVSWYQSPDLKSFQKVGRCSLLQNSFLIFPFESVLARWKTIFNINISRCNGAVVLYDCQLLGPGWRTVGAGDVIKTQIMLTCHSPLSSCRPGKLDYKVQIFTQYNSYTEQSIIRK